MPLRSHRWTDLTRSEIAAARDMGALVVIPMGATEQHSEHLPVGTDSLAAEQLSLLAAEICDRPVLVAPTVSVAFSPHHATWPGTLSLRLSTLSALLEDITSSVARAGFKRQLIVNGHGGNRAPLISTCMEFVTKGREVGFVDYFSPPAADIRKVLTGSHGGFTHAGEGETSLVMALEKDDAGKLAFYEQQARGLESSGDFARRTGRAANPLAGTGGWWANLYLDDGPGYNGEPGLGNVEKGEQLIDVITHSLSAYFTTFATAELKTGMPSS